MVRPGASIPHKAGDRNRILDAAAKSRIPDEGFGDEAKARRALASGLALSESLSLYSIQQLPRLLSSQRTLSNRG